MTAPRVGLALADRVALAVVAVSAVALLLEMTWPHELGAPAPASEAPTEIAQTSLDFVPVGSVADYSVVSERPLFTPDRRPFVFVVEAAPVVAGPRAEFELTAVIITSETQLALLRSSLAPAVQRVTLSQTIDGWTVADVKPDSVVLRRGAESVTVPLRPDLSGARSGHAARVEPGGSGN